MTPKEKAKELIYKFSFSFDRKNQNENVKQCALIAVNEISYNCYEVMKPFWAEVKQEIENL